MQRTLAIVKPDAVANKNTGEILTRIEREGFRVVGMRLVNLSRQDAEGFYEVHHDKPFFADLTAFMSSGPAVVLCLEAETTVACVTAEGQLREMPAEVLAAMPPVAS